VPDGAPRVVTRREGIAAEPSVPRDLMPARRVGDCAEERAGQGAIRAVDIERDQAGSLRLEADGRSARGTIGAAGEGCSQEANQDGCSHGRAAVHFTE
jgi:hypothetical protein